MPLVSEAPPSGTTSTQFVYTAEPTPAAFHLDTQSLIRYIEGPFGSGKTTACVMELIKLGMEQMPDENKRRRSRWAIVRNTYPELKSTTIKSFQEWVPNTIAPVVFGIPITAKLVQRLPDGTTAEIEFMFMALDTEEDVKKLLSLDITGAYINEAREIPWGVFEKLVGRIGRFPATKKDAEGKTYYGPTRRCIVIDSNPPKTSHWLYEKFDTGACPVGWKKYTQPPAVFKDAATGQWVLNPDAENLSHLPEGYYDEQLKLSEEHIRVNLAGEPGMSRKGKPVFQKYSEHVHVSKVPLLPVRGYGVLIGIDFGLTPAVIVGQLQHQGLVLLDEIPATDESLEDFLDQYVIPLMRTKYNGYNVIACGDPTGRNRNSIDKMTSIRAMTLRGVKTYPAITNNPVKRKETVDWFLGRQSGLVVAPHLTFTREAFAAGYVYKEMRNSGGQYTDIPVKNEYSHIMDAVQYLCLYARYGAGSFGAVSTGQLEGERQAAKPYRYA